MKDVDVNNMLAMLADAEARQTAGMVELVAAVVLTKAAPPSGEEIRTVTISPADIANIAQDYHFETRYGDDGMTIHLTKI